jgi:hypothetical protein
VSYWMGRWLPGRISVVSFVLLVSLLFQSWGMCLICTYHQQHNCSVQP